MKLVRQWEQISQRLVLPQQDQAEALQQTFHPQTVGQEEQQQAGASRAVNADHRALLRQETLGHCVTAGRNRRQDEAGVVPVPPAKGRHADFWVLVVMKNLTSAVGMSAQDEARLKPLQQPL